MSIYERAISRHFGLVVLFMIGVAGLAASQLDKVRLDASSDSLLLQGDPDLAFFREATDRYESYEFLILTWEPEAFSTFFAIRFSASWVDFKRSFSRYWFPK